MKNWILRLSAALPLALLAQAANAAPLLYTITGAYSASFILDDHPTAGPDASAPNYFFVDPSDPEVFYIANVTGTFGGHSGLGGITFYSGAAGGGLTITFPNPDTGNYDIPSAVGLQLFAGPVASPTLFAFGPTTFDDFDEPGVKSYTISAVAVPEPASWLMMIGGLGLAGAALRRRNSMRISFA